MLFSTSPPESVYRWFKIFEFLFLGFYFSKQQILKIPEIVKALFLSGVVFSLIGIAQFLLSRTTNLFYFLGERTFNMATPGIALVNLWGAEHLRAYSTFSHPNSLAGFLGVSILFILLSGKLKKSPLNYLGIMIILVCLFLSFSISAYLGFFLVFSFFMFSKNKKYFKKILLCTFFLFILLSLLLPIFSPWIIQTFPNIGSNIGQRLDLAFISGKVVSQKFWFGEGLGTFIINIPNYQGFYYSWLLQPVHNIFLLVFSELGIVGLLGFCYFLYKIFIKNPLVFLFIIFTGLTDHYWLTLQQNLLLLSILSGLSFRISSWKKI